MMFVQNFSISLAFFVISIYMLELMLSLRLVSIFPQKKNIFVEITFTADAICWGV